MRRFSLAVSACGLVVVGASATTARAQVIGTDAMGYPAPTPVHDGRGYVVAPSAPGAGGTYSYLQQGSSAGGMSPNTYYSMNYFTPTPMSGANGYYGAGSRGYAAPAAGYGGVRTAAPTAYQAPTAMSYGPAAPTGAYARANATYYGRRRVGPLRRLFGMGR